MTHYTRPSGYVSEMPSQAFRYDDGPQVPSDRVFLMAVRGGLLPPIFPGQRLLQRLSIMLERPGESLNFDPSDEVIGPLPALDQSFLLSALAEQGRAAQRPVQGEILCDDAGRMYERIGRRIRPLHQVVSGPEGQVLDVVPTAEPDEEAVQGIRPLPKLRVEMRPEAMSAQRFAGSPLKPSPFLKLLPDPGLWRVVLWGEFKGLLVGQIAHPERLRDMHRLPCRVQLYESTVMQSVTSLAAAALGNAEQSSHLHLLSDLLVSRLGLTEVLEMRSPAAPPVRRVPGLLGPHDRVLHLQIAQDPTADGPVPPQPEPVGQNPSPVSSQALAPTRQPSSAAILSLKVTIPDRFMNVWEFHLSREEVQYDLQRQTGRTRLFAGWLKRLISWRASHREIRKWQTLLRGKPIDEQLWSVRPPKRALWNRAVREWVQNTLHLAGYDPGVMLMEWEIFWRRKGL